MTSELIMGGDKRGILINRIDTEHHAGEHGACLYVMHGSMMQPFCHMFYVMHSQTSSNLTLTACAVIPSCDTWTLD